MRFKKGINIDLLVKDVSILNRVFEGDIVFGVFFFYFID